VRILEVILKPAIGGAETLVAGLTVSTKVSAVHYD